MRTVEAELMRRTNSHLSLPRRVVFVRIALTYGFYCALEQINLGTTLSEDASSGTGIFPGTTLSDLEYVIGNLVPSEGSDKSQAFFDRLNQSVHILGCVFLPPKSELLMPNRDDSKPKVQG